MLLFLRIEIQTKAEITRPYTVRESRLTKVCRGFVRHTGDRDVRLRLPEALAGLAGQARLQVEVGPRDSVVRTQCPRPGAPRDGAAVAARLLPLELLLLLLLAFCELPLEPLELLRLHADVLEQLRMLRRCA